MSAQYSVSKAKISLTVLALAAVALFVPAQVFAFTLSPDNIQLTAGATADIKVLAKNANGSNGVALHLEGTNLEVTGVTVASGLLSIGTCADGAKFTTTSVCVDLAGQEEFEDGEVLATISVRKVGSEGAAFTTVGENKYSEGYKVSGVVAKTGGLQAGTETTAGTSADSNTLVILVVAVLAILALTVSGVAISKMSRKSGVTPMGSEPVSPVV